MNGWTLQRPSRLLRFYHMANHFEAFLERETGTMGIPHLLVVVTACEVLSLVWYQRGRNILDLFLAILAVY